MDYLHSDTEIIGKLGCVYPDEEFFKPDFIERVGAAENEISNGNYVEFESMDDFLGSVET